MAPTNKTVNMLPGITLDGATVAILNLDMSKPFEEQIKAYFEGLGNAARGNTHVALDGSGRGLTPVQHTELAAKLGVTEDAVRVINIQPGNKGQVDLTSADKATAGMADLLIQAGLTVEDWTSGRIVFLPGGAGIVAALQAVAIHGISEAWPLTIRLNADAQKVFHVEEVVNPQAMRQWAVGLQGRLDAAKPVASLTGNIPEDFRERLATLAAEFGVEIRG